MHQTHGIGKFVELVQREVSSGTRTPRGPLGTTVTADKVLRDYLVIEYAPSKRGHPGDKLYVPTDQLDLLTRYVGGEAPALSKMGGSDWAAAKGKARKAVRDIAVELVKLYSARMASKGHAFPPDTPWQRELEEAFPFAETPDQLSTIDEVKADMERAIPMDRLISGDVGYGKTEIAVRAAFKAVQDGKQVAMLVPTTLLVRQHMETFSERFAGFPVHLRALSRFQSAKESKETIEGLARGEVDVVIGTHRLLSEGIQFKDLGLVIIDEEQRFGLEHKDALKKLKTNVDILAMSATPIPRTLEMAVTGIREMSTLATPPEDRHPILTYVGAYSDKQVAAAIRRELLREGQVFYVHNRVSSINRVAAQIAELVPEARIAVAHGQLSENVLEQVIVDFWEGKFDVLVTTTIIETGIDIANANTLIIDRADKYGLSQLHQIRGRVGRGRERAYAYFLYDDDKPLSELAQDRLQTIAANNELGGGMQIALKDLEIRGAGNLLGGEQSGHIAGVGFDLYLRMIGEAVATFRGDVAEGQTELRLELPVDAHIPEEYVESERLRLEAYQKLSTAAAPASAEDSIDSVVEELTDRYGELPPQVQNLVAISRLRRIAQKAGLSDVVAMGGNLRIAPAELPDSLQVRLQRLYPGARLFAQAKAISVPLFAGIPNPEHSDSELIAWVTGLLAAIFPAEGRGGRPGRGAGRVAPTARIDPVEAMTTRIRDALAQAIVTLLAVIATVAVSLLIAPEPGPAVLGAMLCLTLSRSQLERDLRGRIEAGIALPVIGLLAAGVGALLVNLRVVGAVVYVIGMFLAIWLRRFGAVPRRIGSLLTLPFIALLVAPNPVPTTVHGPFAVLVPVIVSLVAFVFVTGLQVAAIGIRMLPRPRRAPAGGVRSADAPRLDPSTRLALQMALSLALAFAIGFLFFPDRWAWIALTVVVVAVGNAGRVDVLYKGVQRVLGAAAGTVVAVLSFAAPAIGGPNAATVALLLVVIFLAVFLRPFGYLWWALFFTLALTLVQALAGANDRGGAPLLGERLEEILLGTILALGVAWFVVPLRSESTVRRRIADVLAALQDRLVSQTPETETALIAASTQLARVSPPYDAWRRIAWRSRQPRAGLWIATTRDSVELGREGGSPAAREALRGARRAVRDPENLQPALERLRAALAGEPG